MVDERFSGHETFTCRQFWLKKGYDFLTRDGGNFVNDEAVSILGVGRNMVRSINFWMEAYDLIDLNGEPTQFANAIFKDNGYDPFLEKIETLWLLHANLVMKGYAKTYQLFFNKFRQIRPEFTQAILLKYLENNINNKKQNTNTLKKDIGVFINNYVQKKKKPNTIEEDSAMLFVDLGLIDVHNKGTENWYIVENKSRHSITPMIFLYVLLLNKNYGLDISFNQLCYWENSPGSVLCIHADFIHNLVNSLAIDTNIGLILTEDADLKTVQFSKKPSLIEVLEKVYE
jgi:hypothetical protein